MALGEDGSAGAVADVSVGGVVVFHGLCIWGSF